MAGAASKDPRPSSNFLWYNKPAKLQKSATSKPANPFGQYVETEDGNPWETHALPIGNGRIGAMVFGGDKTERLALNENSFWSGGANPSGGYTYGPEAGKNDFGSYQPFGDIFIDFAAEGESSNYSRSLSLQDGVARVAFTKGGVDYRREVFASQPGQVIVMTCSASKKGALDASFTFKPKHTAVLSSSGNMLVMSGTLKNGMAFEGRMIVIPDKGGSVESAGKTEEVNVTYQGDNPVLSTEKLPSLELKKATSCTVIISLATDYVPDHKKEWKGEAPDVKNRKLLADASKMSASKLKDIHVKNYKSLFDRVKLDLGRTAPAVAQLPTDERIRAYKEKPVDPELEQTVFQFGRYMILSSSRPGLNSLPANLQGLWNDNVRPEWACDYHSNINVEMNYWGVETANLPECHLPLIQYFASSADLSREASRQAFKTQTGGPVRGWTVRTSQNAFGAGGWQWNIPGSAWYAHHMWNHYTFNKDKEYLRDVAYPMMKEISQFWEDHLKALGPDGEGFASDDNQIDRSQLKGLKAGTLVAPHGWSPEQGPREDGIAHDQQLIWDLFNNTIQAARELDADREWAAGLEKKRDLLAAPRISPEGDLQEWMIDRPGLKRGHRHTSHLFAVYPGSQISMEKTPELALASKKSLELRGTTGDSRRSWTWPWRTALWARFHEGDKAHEMVSGIIRYNMLPNMLAAHPPMQIDGTLGITGGMAEMLVQSHADEISLLPAPTSAWSSGKVEGLKARGNVTVGFSWKDGKVKEVYLTSPHPQPVKVRVNGEVKMMTPDRLHVSPKKNK